MSIIFDFSDINKRLLNGFREPEKRIYDPVSDLVLIADASVVLHRATVCGSPSTGAVSSIGGNTGAFTLTTAELPSHSHTFTSGTTACGHIHTFTSPAVSLG